ncbi:MAG: tetratricopeptide repeat protein [Gloeobacteraceae cyanobacterium ES-bin-144]|nr:tetratricopeptide repeat protein [Verrucomicrobiales bacterium]
MSADLKESSVPLAEISHGPSAFELFLDRNQKNLIILTILIGLGTAAYVVYRGVESSNQKSAGAALNNAKTLSDLQSVVTEHAGTNAASSAVALLADAQWKDGQQEAGLETLKKFISSDLNDPTRPSAQANLASKLMIQGKTAEAEQVFLEIVNDPKDRFIAPYALICLGDIAKIAGDPSKAESSYSRVKSEFPESSFAETANRRIAILKAKPPAEIAPPPAPATPTSNALTPSLDTPAPVEAAPKP